ncbi:filamentous hemagglutinin N-terminal domain-containing protein [Leptolyngbya sp. NK1-12]|uniref:Filamentous hemagglutinin N-terminal domain-containing protein n=1 Tax=Leptolyngbya sp. NK1-12 TaxID=2547451 RepID=A0AA97AS02_9CYAN|nr:filamentous hemagglutinin N-terminal domain-containing protein [Leptolyngbya sp. NK1-12]WNZ26253.1 filamentous hemagglutinin N-terminal domain-containing protein [Leptolyngbya sp. NK1-12]
MQRVIWAGLASLAVSVLGMEAEAQVVPDATLGADSSRVRRAAVRGRAADLIEGGAARDRNLFHSFQEFGIREGDAAYFANPARIENIFGRVTGNNPSNILGTLGVDGAANLFLMNPNGILFGSNASLDVQGSFVGTTANAIQFGEQGFFSAGDGVAPGVLTVNPSAFFFNQVNPSGSIINQSATPNSINPQFVDGLRVSDGQSLLLLGNEIRLQQGKLFASSGHVELGAVAEGVVGITVDGNRLDLNFPTDLRLGSIDASGSIIDASGIQSVSTSGGEIEIQGSQVTLTNSSILSNGFGSQNNGNIALRANQLNLTNSSIATNTSATAGGGGIRFQGGGISMLNGSRLVAETNGQGSAGNITISTDSIEISGTLGNRDTRTRIASETSGVGNSGNITVSTRQLNISEGAIISTSTEPNSQGQGGILTISALDTVNLSGVSDDGTRAALAAETRSSGSGGSINVNTRQLTIQDGAIISINAIEGTSGSASNLTINSTESVRLSGTSAGGSRAAISAQTGGSGSGGSILINTPQLIVQNGGIISVNAIQGSSGQSGNLTINASELVQLSGVSLNRERAALSAETGGSGQGGDINIQTRNFIVENGGIASANAIRGSSGRGGNIVITASESVRLSGISQSIQQPSTLTARTQGTGQAGNIQVLTEQFIIQDGATISIRVQPEASGNGGNLTIFTGSLSLLNGAGIRADTAGQGSASNILIKARDRISLDGTSTVISSTVEPGAVGQGGNIQIFTDTLSLASGAQLQASTVGEGNAGSVIINATDSVSLDDAAILSTVEQGGIGAGGNIDLTSRSLTLTDGAQLLASTFGQGNAGRIIINATDSVSLDGRSGTFTGGIFSTVEQGGIGAGGNIDLTSRSLTLTDGAQLQASTRGQGDAGRIIINATNSVFLDGVDRRNGRSSAIATSAEATATGRGNSVQIATPTLRLINGAVINAGTANSQPGGNITINANTLEATSGGQLITSTLSSGKAGDITLNVRDNITFSGRDLTFNDRLTTFGRDVTANEGNGESGLFANTRPNSTGNGGTITLNANTLNLLDGAQITAFTAGTGNPGNIQIRDTDTINLNNSTISTTINSGAALSNPNSNLGNIDIQARSLALNNNAQITASTSGQGNAGNIFVRDAESITLDNNSTISTAVNADAIGQGGSITLGTDTLALGNRSNITSSTSGTGSTGRITINASDRTTLADNSSITSTVNSTATGDSQQITLNTPNLSLSDSQISASTAGTGDAGNISVQGAETISLNNSSISTAVETPQTRGDGGNLEIQTGELTLNHSRISSSTAGIGDTGNITINASDRINLRNRSRITNRVQQGATGNSQTIRLNTPQLSLRGNSRLSAATNGIGQAGNVIVQNADSIFLGNSTISTQIGANGIVPRPANQPNRSQPADQRSNILLDTNSLTLNNGARITANTANRGDAGNITVRNAETISLNQSTISSAVGENASGQGGNIQLNTSSLNLDNARISARTQAQGRGGDIVVNAEDTIQTTDSDIETFSDSSSSGDINLSAAQIRLRGDSDIRTQVNQGEGSGGNITLSADAIVAFDDSDIVTRAPEGQGGNIRFDTPAFFGEAYIPDTRAAENNQVEVDASGVRSGVVTAPDVSFIQNSLADLPTSAINTDQLLANSCIARTETGGTFLITGTGGLPAAPGNDAASAYPTGEVRAIPTEEAPTDWQPGDPIVEPQGVYRLPDGRLVMSRDCFDQQAK